MKKTITAITLVLVSIALNAREIATSGNLVLDHNEPTGMYSIVGDLGIIVLGDRASASDLLIKMEKSFIEKKFSIGDPDYTVGEDEDGLYIIRIGLGGVKIRPADAAKFVAAMNINALGSGMKSGFEAGIREFKKAMK